MFYLLVLTCNLNSLHMTEFAICFENIIKHQLSAKSSTRHACFIQVKFQFFVVFCVENCLYKTMTVQHFRDLLVLAGAHTHCLSYLCVILCCLLLIIQRSHYPCIVLKSTD